MPSMRVQGALKSGHLSERCVMLYPHWVVLLVFLDDGYASKSSSSAISNHALSEECGRHVIKVRFFMRFLQISFVHRIVPCLSHSAMSPSRPSWFSLSSRRFRHTYTSLWFPLLYSSMILVRSYFSSCPSFLWPRFSVHIGRRGMSK